MNRLSDSVVSPRGRAFNDICIQSGIGIINERCEGDLSGKFTCHNYHGSSIVHYACVSERWLPRINLFTIHNFMADFSDHCKILSFLFFLSINGLESLLYFSKKHKPQLFYNQE